jgi:hypothetical protein
MPGPRSDRGRRLGEAARQLAIPRPSLPSESGHGQRLVFQIECLYIHLYMKAIQVTVDERLLKSLDASAAAKRDGRSAVIRRALAQYLARRRSAELDERIRRAYGKTPVDPELEGWEQEGTWPSE